MSVESDKVDRVDEPQDADQYAEVLSQVAAGRQAVIVRRDGADLAAVISLDYLSILQEAIAQRGIEELSAKIDWDRARHRPWPPAEWFEGEEPKPF
jgi:PHD/YefM family antitoxin component YafN of YafNO toxin-antitoxin module